MGFILRMVALVYEGFRRLTLAEKAGLITGGMSLTDTILTKIVGHDLKQEAFRAIVEETAQRTGLQLDPADPFSDASLSGAVGQRIGVPLRSLKNAETIKEDLEAYALQVISQRSGYELHSVTDVAILRADFQRIACAMLTEKLQLPVGVFPDGDGEIDPAAVRENLLAWAKAELANRVEWEVGYSLDEIKQIGDIETLAAELNGRLAAVGSDQVVTARQIALHVSNKMAVQSIADYGRVSQDIAKATRRQLQLRAAQARFRAKNGNRQKYVPLGMTATIGPEP